MDCALLTTTIYILFALAYYSGDLFAVKILLTAHSPALVLDAKRRLPLQHLSHSKPTAAAAAAVRAAFALYLGRRGMQRIEAVIAAQRCWGDVLQHFATRCVQCGKLLHECSHLKQRDFPLWLYKHSVTLPHE
jgi:hypothetical protein